MEDLVQLPSPQLSTLSQFPGLALACRLGIIWVKKGRKLLEMASFYDHFMAEMPCVANLHLQQTVVTASVNLKGLSLNLLNNSAAKLGTSAVIL